MNKPKGRAWFRFSLRSLLVVVTLVCMWLAWESSVVRTRKAALQEASKTPAFQFVTAEEWLQFESPSGAQPQAARVSLVRKWLGDKAIQTIEFNKQYGNFQEQELARLKRTFPEAEVREVHIPMEPCHPGCFPRGTLVLTGEARRPIESMQVGDSLTAMLASGEIVSAHVQSIFVTQNRLWKIRTEAGELITTETQPLLLAADTYRAAGELESGDKILRLIDGEVHSTTVLSVSRTERVEQVINLVLGDLQAFVVGDGYFARSKPPPESVAGE